MITLLYILIQITWGVLQSLFGLCLFIKYRKCEHKMYHGSILTFHDGDFGGVSLGCFIFVSGTRGEEYKAQVAVHEYGHTIQSLIFGPLYLFIVGLPSAIWCNGKRNIALRQEKGIKYCSRFPENWANRLGQAVTKLPPYDN